LQKNNQRQYFVLILDIALLSKFVKREISLHLSITAP